VGWFGLDWSGSSLGQKDSSCECGKEPSGSIKFWETIEWLQLVAYRVVLSLIELVSWLVPV
jgi:hypothetical protein